MGDIISKIHDDYDDYIRLCEEVGEKPKSLRVERGGTSFYDHEKILKEKYGKTKTHGYKKNE